MQITPVMDVSLPKHARRWVIEGPLPWRKRMIHRLPAMQDMPDDGIAPLRKAGRDARSRRTTSPMYFAEETPQGTAN